MLKGHVAVLSEGQKAGLPRLMMLGSRGGLGGAAKENPRVHGRLTRSLLSPCGRQLEMTAPRSGGKEFYCDVQIHRGSCWCGGGGGGIELHSN